MTLTEAYERRIEFYNHNHSKQDGRFTSGPGGTRTAAPSGKMWSGVSAHPDRRTKPTPGAFEAVRTMAKRVYETDLGGGYSSHVTDTNVFDKDDGTVVTAAGEIRLNGVRRGYFERSLYKHADGTITADHELLVIDGDHKGHGLADRFNAHAVAEYQRMGVDHITLTAGDAEYSVGGYAWARQGFRLNGSPKSNKAFIDRQLSRMYIQVLKPVYREHAEQIRAEIAALSKALEAGEDVQPIHIASIGEKYARHETADEEGVKYQTWPGKDVLLGTSWKAVYYFDANKQLSAAATDLEHADLRPKFRYEWIDFACHDASCRPPGSGGTGGSLKSGTATSAGPKVKEAYLSRTAGTATPGTTEFGRRINKMLDDDPKLMALSKADIDAEYGRLVDLQHSIDEDELIRKYTVATPHITQYTTARHSTEWVVEHRDEMQAEVDAYKEMEDAIRRVKQIRDEEYVAVNPSEKALQDAIDQRIAADDIYWPVIVNGAWGQIVLNGVTKTKHVKSVAVDDATEQAVIGVGHEIRKEIDARFAARFDAAAEEARHAEGMAKVRALAETSGPLHDGRERIGDRAGGSDTITMTRFSGGELHVMVRMEYGGVLAQGHPVIAQIKEVLTQYGISTHVLTYHMANKANVVHNLVLHEVLGEITQLGGRLTATPKNAKTRYGGASSHTQVVAAVKEYPEAWINETNLGNPLRFRQTSGRAHYQHSANDGKSEITLDGSVSTAIHEFAHRFERTIPGVLGLEARFFDRRTVGETEKRLGAGYGKNEVGKEDKFFNKYAGKTYHGNAYELLSMGYEHLHSRRDWAIIDGEYQAFVLGTLVSAYRG